MDRLAPPSVNRPAQYVRTASTATLYTPLLLAVVAITTSGPAPLIGLPATAASLGSLTRLRWRHVHLSNWLITAVLTLCLVAVFTFATWPTIVAGPIAGHIR